MLYCIISRMTFMMTVLLPALMVASRGKIRNRFGLRLSLCCIVILLTGALFGAAYYALYAEQITESSIYFELVRFLTSFAMAMACCGVCFRLNIWGALYCGTAGYCIQHVSARINAIVEDFWLPDGLNRYLLLAKSQLVALLVFFAFYMLLIRRVIHKESDMSSQNRWQILIALIVVGETIFYNTFGLKYVAMAEISLSEAGADLYPAKWLLGFVYNMSLLTAVLALVIELGFYQNERISAERNLVLQMLEEQRKQFEDERKNAELINIKCHDLRHQLLASRERLDEGEIDEALHLINIYDSGVKTGNEALDIILSKKGYFCRENGIRLNCSIRGSCLNRIPAHEIYSLFGNAVENAIESVLKLPEEMRIINMVSRNDQNFAEITVENYFDGDIRFLEGLPQTKKEDKASHGFGIKSMKLIVEKYGGSLAAEADGQVFRLSIVLPVTDA